MNINIKTNKNFTTSFNKIIEKYGEEFEYLNGFHDTQMNYSDFIDGFVDKNITFVIIINRNTYIFFYIHSISPFLLLFINNLGRKPLNL